MCPGGYPFAYKNGKLCCASDKEDSYFHFQLDKCKGRPISIDSNCCKGKHISCPSGSCVNSGINCNTKYNSSM